MDLKDIIRDVGYSNSPLLRDDLVVLPGRGPRPRVDGVAPGRRRRRFGTRLYVRDRKVLVAIALDVTTS